jgi:hypothetical protein
MATKPKKISRIEGLKQAEKGLTGLPQGPGAGSSPDKKRTAPKGGPRTYNILPKSLLEHHHLLGGAELSSIHAAEVHASGNLRTG